MAARARIGVRTVSVYAYRPVSGRGINGILATWLAFYGLGHERLYVFWGEGGRVECSLGGMGDGRLLGDKQRSCSGVDWR